MVRREWVDKKNLKAGAGKLEIQSHDRYFITSHSPDRGKQTALEIRAHWSVENKNHYKKDTSVWREDEHRHRRANVAQNLALMRSALLAIIPFDDKKNLGDCLRLYERQTQKAIKLVQRSLPV